MEKTKCCRLCKNYSLKVNNIGCENPSCACHSTPTNGMRERFENSFGYITIEGLPYGDKIADWWLAELSRIEALIVEELKNLEHPGTEINFTEDNEAAIENRTIDQALTIVREIFKKNI